MMQLSTEDKKYLLKVARDTVISSVRGEPRQTYKPVSDITAECRGAFVTLRKQGQLRGCIGLIEAMKPLVDTVQEMAVAASLRDSRFNPVAEDELEELDIEISAMSPVKAVDSTDKIEVGKDGLIVRCAGMQGLLLPQVATEYNWDRETFLEQTCRKAGLPPDAWKMDATEICSFRAEVFGEKDQL